MNAAELKLKIFRQIDSLDNSRLEEFYGITTNYINSKKDFGDWLDVTEEEIEALELALAQLEAGKGIPHDVVMKEMKAKYFND